MNPQEPQQQNYQPPTEPQQQNQQPPADSQLTPAAAPQIQAPKSHKKLALWLIIGPSALFILTIVLFALSNFLFSASQPADGELFGETSPVKTIFNIVFFLGMAVSFITWLPGLVIGIVLLAKQPK